MENFSGNVEGWRRRQRGKERERLVFFHLKKKEKKTKFEVKLIFKPSLSHSLSAPLSHYLTLSLPSVCLSVFCSSASIVSAVTFELRNLSLFTPSETNHRSRLPSSPSSPDNNPPTLQLKCIIWHAGVFLPPPLSSQRCTRCPSYFFFQPYFFSQSNRPLPLVRRHLPVCVMFLLHLHFNGDFFPDASLSLYLSRLIITK